MPYNLRKRKAPEPELAPAVKKSAPKKEPKRKPTVKEPAPEEIEHDEPAVEEQAPEEKKRKPSAKKPAAESSKRKPATKRPAPEEIDQKPSVKKSAPEDTNHEPTSKSPILQETKPAAKRPASEEIDSKAAVEKPTPKEAAISGDQAESGTQLMFGEDSCGELGLREIGLEKKKPTAVLIKEKIKQVACGAMHTLSLTESGIVYSYGCNDEGALGRVTDGNEELEATPTIVKLSCKVIKITAGDSHSLALSEEQEVFVWGNFRDEHGPIGLTPDTFGEKSIEPIQLLPQTKFKDIASGANHVLLLDTKGVVYSFGVAAQGQLGRLGPDEIGTTEKATAITKENSKLFLAPRVVDLKDVDPTRPFVCDAIYAGNWSSFATNTDKKKNRLAAWGLNNYYQLGYKGKKGQLVQHYPRRSTFTCSTSMTSVACGQHHTLFLTRTGRVYAAGRNEYGMLGIGKSAKDKKEVCPAAKVEDGFNDEPIASICVGINTSFAVDTAGKLFAWGMKGLSLGISSGDDDLIVPTLVKNLADKEVLSVSTGTSTTAVIIKS